MDDSIKRYKQRRDARIKEKANADEEWITMKGSHILIDDGGKVKAGAGGKFNGTEYKRGNKNVKEENRPHAGKYVNMLEESGFREKKGAKAEGDMDKWEKEAFDRYEQRLADIDEKGFVRMMREAQKDRDVSQKMLDDLYNDGCERLGLSEREANKLFAKHQSALKKPPSGWRTKEEIGAKPSEGKTKAESARGRMAESPKIGSPEGKKRAAENFLSDNREKIDSEKGLQIAENNFRWAGMSNEQALKVLNSMGKGEYEIYEEKEPGTMWTNWAPVIKTYIRKKGKSEKKEGSMKSGAEAARDRMIERTKRSSGGKSVDIEKSPDKPVKPTMKGCTKASDSALQEMGGEHWDKSTPDTDVWEFSGKVSATSAAKNILNGLRKKGYDAVFTTASGKVSEKPTSQIWVRDPKNDYNFVEYSVYRSKDSSAPGKTYLSVDKKITN